MNRKLGAFAALLFFSFSLRADTRLRAMIDSVIRSTSSSAFPQANNQVRIRNMSLPFTYTNIAIATANGIITVKYNNNKNSLNRFAFEACSTLANETAAEYAEHASQLYAPNNYYLKKILKTASGAVGSYIVAVASNVASSKIFNDKKQQKLFSNPSPVPSLDIIWRDGKLSCNVNIRFRS